MAPSEGPLKKKPNAPKGEPQELCGNPRYLSFLLVLYVKNSVEYRFL